MSDQAIICDCCYRCNKHCLCDEECLSSTVDWDDSITCIDCFEERNLRNEMVKIMPKIWLGGLGQAICWKDKNPEGIILCVADYLEFALNKNDHKVVFIPILMGGWNTELDRWDEWVDPILLAIACNTLDFCVKEGYDVAVCCAMGQERSPLTIAWYMHTIRGIDLDEAFKFLKSKKGDIIDRRDWLKEYSKEKHESDQKELEEVFN